MKEPPQAANGAAAKPTEGVVATGEVTPKTAAKPAAANGGAAKVAAGERKD